MKKRTSYALLINVQTRISQTAFLICFLLLITSTSCSVNRSFSNGSYNDTAKSRTMVYISSADSREIHVLELNLADGSLKLVEKKPVSGTVMPLAVSPNHKYLYASLRSEPYSVGIFEINQENGSLLFKHIGPLADNMANISVDKTGQYLFGASYNGNKISVNAITTDGLVSSKPIMVLSTGKNAHAIITDPSNAYLFVSALGADCIFQYFFDSLTGEIKPNIPSAVYTKKNAGPRHLAFHPERNFLYAVNELDGTVTTYTLSKSGTLKLRYSTSVMPSDVIRKPWASDIHLTPDGKFLYTAERTSSTITAFRVSKRSGRLKLIGHYPTENQPRSFNIDPDGRFLLAVGQKSNGLSTYKINEKSGKLIFLSHLEVGKNPNWIEIIKLSSGQTTF